VNGSLVMDLGLGPVVWLFLTLLGCVTLFFKWGRFWSIRNLDLLLLFAPGPGLMMCVGRQGNPPWIAFVLLFLGTFAWLARLFADLGFSRRPLLEPNLSASGLLTLSIGVLGLLLVETVNLPVEEGAKRTSPPAPPRRRRTARSSATSSTPPPCRRR